MSSIDTNLSNYTVLDLVRLLGLEGKPEITDQDIIDATNMSIEQHQRANPGLAVFYKQVQQRLIEMVHSEHGGDTTDYEDYDYESDGGGGGEGGEGAADHAQALAEAQVTNIAGDPSLLSQENNSGRADGFNHQASRDIMGLQEDPDAALAPGLQQLKWQHYQYLEDADAKHQYTSRENKVEISRDENDHYQMKKKRLGVINAYNLPVAQGTTNPVLRNTMSRIINVDSQYRQTIFPYSNNPDSPSSATNFTLILTQPLKNILSLKLSSIHIPYSWFLIDAAVGNNKMWVDLNSPGSSDNSQIITVPDGNYTAESLVAAVQTQIDANPLLKVAILAQYSRVTGRCIFYNKTEYIVTLTFYDATQTLIGGVCDHSTKINNNLGWFLGFRSNNLAESVTGISTFRLNGLVYEMPVADLVAVATAEAATGSGIPGYGKLESEAAVDTYGPKYFLLSIDDFNHNRVNSGMVSVGSIDTRLDVPNYYNADVPFVCQPNLVNNQTMPIYVPSVPRRLTQAQLYSLNQIVQNRSNTLVTREPGPSTSDVFAIVSLRKTGLGMGDPFIDYGPALLQNTRTYFGPVQITKLRVTLKDDKGYIVNLHGNDWSFTLVTEELYEY